MKMSLNSMFIYSAFVLVMALCSMGIEASVNAQHLRQLTTPGIREATARQLVQEDSRSVFDQRVRMLMSPAAHRERSNYLEELYRTIGEENIPALVDFTKGELTAARMRQIIQDWDEKLNTMQLTYDPSTIDMEVALGRMEYMLKMKLLDQWILYRLQEKDDLKHQIRALGRVKLYVLCQQQIDEGARPLTYCPQVQEPAPAPASSYERIQSLPVSR